MGRLTGGISITQQRAAHFLFTKPVLQFGKIPLMRCDDINRFASLQDIDQANVRIVENAGGTNAMFARKTIKHAKIIIVNSNQATIQYLLKRQADEMFTDNIEAHYREKIIPGLCVNKSIPLLTRNYKAYMLPRKSSQFLKRVNAWLQRQQSIHLLKKAT